MTRKPLILSVLTFGLAVFAVAAWYMTRPGPETTTASAAPEYAEALVRGYSPVLGPKEAPVTIVEFFEAVLREQSRWASHGASEPGRILQIAGSAGLDAEVARTQMLAPDVVAILNQDRADVETMGIRGTPTFFVNGRLLDPFGETELRTRVAEEVAGAGS